MWCGIFIGVDDNFVVGQFGIFIGIVDYECIGWVDVLYCFVVDLFGGQCFVDIWFDDFLYVG